MHWYLLGFHRGTFCDRYCKAYSDKNYSIGEKIDRIKSIPLLSAVDLNLTQEYFDKIDELEGLVVGCGFSGHGFGIAPAAAMVLSELAMGKEASVDISGLRYDRFVAKA